MRKTLVEEFLNIWVLNLRGNQRTSGELSRKRRGKIFGSGSRTPVTITFLVYNPSKKQEPCKIHYHDIGDYLTRERKLEILKEASSIQQIKWESLHLMKKPTGLTNAATYLIHSPLAPERSLIRGPKSLFVTNAMSIFLNRDSWVYSFSEKKLAKNMKSCIEFYNSQRELYKKFLKSGKKLEDIISNDPTKISWTRGLRRTLSNNKEITYSDSFNRISTYRPYPKTIFYGQGELIESYGLSPKLFPTPDTQNLVICVSTGEKGPSPLITNNIPDLHTLMVTHNASLSTTMRSKAKMTCSRKNSKMVSLTGPSPKPNAFMVPPKKPPKTSSITSGFLHSKDYRETFKDDLKSLYPKSSLFLNTKISVPLSVQAAPSQTFMNYEKSSDEAEKIAKALGINITGNKLTKTTGQTYTPEDYKYFRIDKMRFTKKPRQTNKKYSNNSIAIETSPSVLTNTSSMANPPSTGSSNATPSRRTKTA